MSFKSNLGGIRAWGRKLVLPSGQIKELLLNEVLNHQIDTVIDFGAGTLYWSEWLGKQVGAENVCPVDVIYKDTMPETSMRCYSSIFDVQVNGGTKVFFTCDVLHHLQPEEWSDIQSVVFDTCQFVVIKDINCHYKFKNLMNKMHDRIINGEHIRDVDPYELMDKLRKSGYRCVYRDLHKLWYPHFMIIASKNML